MALEEDSWSQQAVGISLNPGDMVLQLAPNVLFLLDSLKTFQGRVKMGEDYLEVYCILPYPVLQAGMSQPSAFCPEFCVPAKYQEQMQLSS